ncbi:MAG: GIY-YIG nuclease family protein [Lachnospiraceae bacterium]|nr:GIY-YIG nuclease family protein [Lachnospiraceae bacterium]
MKTNYTYILHCSDDTLYTGWTTDLEHRLSVHNAGKGAKYTRSRLPVVLAYYEGYETKEEAMRREWEIKQLSRSQKLKLLADFHSDFPV